MLPDEAETYLAKYGVEAQLSKVILAGYKSLGLIHYFTAGPGEVRAWTVRVSIHLSIVRDAFRMDKKINMHI